MNQNYLCHYGVLGMKWGVRRSKTGYRSTSIRSAVARRQNDTVDASFNTWKENSKKKTNAIDAGKKRNADKIAYESNKKNKELKSAYKQSTKVYKKALKSNTTYRKGQVKSEVGHDMARKYLTQAKRVKKQLDQDPSNKALKKQYTSLMNKYDVTRASARRAPQVAAARSSKKASIKRAATMTVKAAATTAAIGVGVAAVNKQIQKNGGEGINAENVAKYAKAAADLLKFI